MYGKMWGFFPFQNESVKHKKQTSKYILRVFWLLAEIEENINFQNCSVSKPNEQDSEGVGMP